jgi:Ca2+-binding RTX toxin-like protein
LESITDLNHSLAGFIANISNPGAYLLVDGDAVNGGSLADEMAGFQGRDLLRGLAGNDTLDGGDGDALLLGGAGADALRGGTGNDIAIYDGSTSGVTVNLATGAASGGDAEGDSLTAIEGLIGSGGNDILTGNALVNVLVGDAGNDSLAGGDGDDRLTGGAGADALHGGAGNDTAIYSGSTFGVTVNLATGAAWGADAAGDTLRSIENLVGSAHADSLTGDARNNVLNGGLGSDVLSVGAGRDVFAFNTALGAGNVDQITDFSPIDDTIRLDDAVFTALGGTGVLSATAFAIGATAGDADDRIMYDSATGALYYDADGTATTAQVQFATLTSHPTGLTNADFLVI